MLIMKKLLLIVLLLIIVGVAGVMTGLIKLPQSVQDSLPSGFSEADLTNVALNKPARLSSTLADQGKASNAVDGNRSGVWQEGSIAHSRDEVNPWWEVDLGAEYDIASVTIHNRTDCCQDRLDGARVYAGKTPIEDNDDRLVGALNEVGAGQEHSVNVDTRARYVRIVIPTGGEARALNIAEVEVMGVPARGKRDDTERSVASDRAFATAAGDIIKAAGKPAKAAESTVDTVGAKENRNSNDGKFAYDYQTVKETKQFTEVLNLGLNDDVMWAGNVLNGAKIQKFVYEPVNLPRAPLTISASIEGRSGNRGELRETIENPSLSGVRQGIADILDRALGDEGSTANRANLEITEIYDKSQIGMELNVDGSYGFFSGKADIQGSTETEKNYLLATYKQVYYTIDVDEPSNPADFFSPTTPLSRIRDEMRPGTDPVYVSSVTYGMFATILMESTASHDEMRAALQASYDNLVNSADISAKASYDKVKRDSKITVEIYGGSSSANSSFVNDDVRTALSNVIQASQTFGPDAPGLPISYKFRSLNDNVLTGFARTSQYTVRSTKIALQNTYEISVDRLKADGDIGGESEFEIGEFYLDVSSYENPKGKEDKLRILSRARDPEQKFRTGALLIGSGNTLDSATADKKEIVLDKKFDGSQPTLFFDYDFRERDEDRGDDDLFQGYKTIALPAGMNVGDEKIEVFKAEGNAGVDEDGSFTVSVKIRRIG